MNTSLKRIPRKAREADNERGATLTGYALVLATFTSVTLGTLGTLEENSGEYLTNTGQVIAEPLEGREYLATSILDNPPDWAEQRTTTTSTTTTVPTTASTVAPTTTPTTAAPTTTTTTTTTTVPTTATPAITNIAGLATPSISSLYRPESSGDLLTNGNKSGEWSNGKFAHTNQDVNPYAQLVLPSPAYIDTIDIYNRVGTWASRATNVWVIVSDSPISDDLTTAKASVGTVVNIPGQVGRPSTVSIGATGQYVKIFIEGTQYLHLAEVEINGYITP